MADNNYTPCQPKLTTETIKALEPLVTICASYNQNMSSGVKLILEENMKEQASLASFKLIKNALKEKIVPLSSFLWSQSINTNMDEEQILKIIQFNLTEFAGKRNRPQQFEPKQERTFWVDKVVPLFQSIGDQTGLLGFEWCEKNPESFYETTTDLKTWKHGPARYVDGLGCMKGDYGVIVMEASSGKCSESLEHSKDDNLKNIHGSICALEAFLRRFPDAKFETASKLMAFSVQSICATITLAITTIDLENPGSFFNQERRSAEIPASYDERLKCFKVFELVTTLVIMLRKQESTIEELKKEQSGAMPINTDETVRFVLF